MVAGDGVGEGWSFNPPPFWPKPPAGWSPSPSWRPDPAWGPVPPGWQLWTRSRSGLPRIWGTALAGLLAALLIAAAVRIPRAAGADPPPFAPVLAVRALSTPAPAASPTATATPTAPRTATVPAVPATRRFGDCRQLNAAYPHGLGRPGATDRVPARARGAARTRVSNFARSAGLYQANARLDSDRDGVACERP